MTEPATITAAAAGGIATVLITWFGPAAPEYVLILACALIGVLHPFGKREFATWKKAALYIFTWVGTALVLTGAAVALIDNYLHFPATRWPGAVAFCITFLSDRWPVWIDAVLTARFLGPLASKSAEARASQRGPL